MAKLGMPSISIFFQEAGIEAVERSQRGIAAMILEEEKSVIDKLFSQHEYEGETLEALSVPHVVYTLDDIPAELSGDNKDYITKCMLGY